MARKLPWTADVSPVPRKPREEHGIQKTPSRDHNTKAPLAKTSETPSQLRHTRPEPQSPPSSPVRESPQPTPQVEPMRTGPFGDDRYIMVEDEFEAVAKTFTAHLHAAEYERLRRKAREAPLKPLPDLSSNTTITTRLSLERKKLQLKQTRTLRGVFKSNEKVEGKRGENNDDLKQEEEEAKIDDLWSGTSLAGLMEEGSSSISRQMKPSLMCLQRLHSSTRAAKGYSRGETDSSPKKKRKTILDIFDPDSKEEDQGREDTTFKRDRQNQRDQRRAGDRKETTTPAPAPVSVPSSSSSSSNHRKIASTTTTTTTATKKTPKRNYIDKLDDFDESQFQFKQEITSLASSRIKPEPSSPSSSSRLTSKPRHAKKRLDMKEEDGDDVVRQGQKDRKKSRLDEVPVFLV